MRDNIRQLFDLSGRVALCTGGSSGIGRRMALTLSQALTNSGLVTIIADALHHNLSLVGPFGAMVGIYFKTKRLPVRFLIYIAITALTRVLAINVKTMTDLHMITITGSILVLALAVLVVRVGSSKYPSKDS